MCIGLDWEYCLNNNLKLSSTAAKCSKQFLFFIVLFVSGVLCVFLGVRWIVLYTWNNLICIGNMFSLILCLWQTLSKKKKTVIRWYTPFKIDIIYLWNICNTRYKAIGNAFSKTSRSHSAVYITTDFTHGYLDVVQSQRMTQRFLELTHWLPYSISSDRTGARIVPVQCGHQSLSIQST